MLSLTTKENVILFDQKYYSQIDEVAMESPLGPTLANFIYAITKLRGYKTVRNLSNQCIIKDTSITFLCCLKNRNKFHDLLSTWIKDTKILNFRLKLKKIIPFLFSMLRSVGKKIHNKFFQKRYGQ